MQAEQKLGWEEKVWKSVVLGVKRAAVRKAGCGQLSDPPVGWKGPALHLMHFDARRSWAKRAAFRINGRRLLVVGVDQWRQGARGEEVSRLQNLLEQRLP